MTKCSANAIVLLLFAMISFTSCSLNRRIDRTANRLYGTMLGRWQVNSKTPSPENNLVRKRGLPRGVIVFYPNNSFMYQNNNGRYTGSWEIEANTEFIPGSEFVVPDQEYVIYTVFLNFRSDNEKYIPGVVMEMHYARRKKMKFVEAYTTVNIFKRR